YVPSQLPVLLFPLPPLPGVVPRLPAEERPSSWLRLRPADFGPGNTVKHRQKFPGPETAPKLLQVPRPALSRSGWLVPGSRFVQAVHRFGAFEILPVNGSGYFLPYLYAELSRGSSDSCPPEFGLPLGRQSRSMPRRGVCVHIATKPLAENRNLLEWR